MDEKQELVYNLIKDRKKANPLTSRNIEVELNLRGSEVRDCVRELRRLGHLIGSISKKDEQEGGYYIIQDKEDYDQTIQHLKNRVESLSNTIYKMQVAWIQKDRKQTELF